MAGFRYSNEERAAIAAALDANIENLRHVIDTSRDPEKVNAARKQMAYSLTAQCKIKEAQPEVI